MDSLPTKDAVGRDFSPPKSQSFPSLSIHNGKSRKRDDMVC
jgi:hypothetical protein